MARIDRPRSSNSGVSSDSGPDFDEVVRAVEAICNVLVKALPIAGAGVTVQGAGGRTRLVAATSRDVEQLIGIQMRAGQGTIGAAVGCRQPVEAMDLQASRAWSWLAPAVSATGMVPVTALPLCAGGEVLGTLHLCGDVSTQLEEGDLATAQAAATAIASCVEQAWRGHRIEHTVAQLQHALTARIVTEQAKGMIASRKRIAPTEAFEQLRRYARRNNLRVHDVAHRIVSGELATLDLPD